MCSIFSSPGFALQPHYSLTPHDFTSVVLLRTSFNTCTGAPLQTIHTVPHMPNAFSTNAKYMVFQFACLPRFGHCNPLLFHKPPCSYSTLLVISPFTVLFSIYPCKRYTYNFVRDSSVVLCNWVCYPSCKLLQSRNSSSCLELHPLSVPWETFYHPFYHHFSTGS